jgi:BMFP domain-containing protein YqiC
MNQGPNRIFDEFAKLMTDAAGAAQGVAKEAETALQSQFERFLNNADIVKRDELEQQLVASQKPAKSSPRKPKASSD